MSVRWIGANCLWLSAVLALAAGAGAATPAFDLLLRNSEDPDLLSPRQAILRQHLLDLGADPMRAQRPTLDTILQRRLAERANWDNLGRQRMVEIFEVDWDGGLVKVIRYPEHHLFFTQIAENIVGVAFEPERDFADSLVVTQVDHIEAWNRHNVAIARNDRWEQSVATAKTQQEETNQALNFRIPIKIPRSLERIIGRGDATNIRISGQESIRIGGESTVRNDFLPNEYRQSQSLFPSLDMEQRLRVDLSGSVGEKIQVRVTHNSEAGLGQKSTEVKMEFVGDEDDIVQSIRAGDIDVTLPGSGLLGIGTGRGGLFGIRIEGAVGPMSYTLFTSKEQSQSNTRSFNSSGGTPTPFAINSTDYVRNRFFRLFAPESYYFDATETPNLYEIVTDESAASVDAQGLRVDPNSIEVYISGTGLQTENTIGFARAYIDSLGLGWQDGARTEVPATALGQISQDLTYPSNLWRYLEPERDWYPLEIDGQFTGILLASEAPKNEAVGVAFNLIDAAGTVVRRVGQRTQGDPDFVSITDPFNGSEGSYFKLIKMPDSEAADPYKNLEAGKFGRALLWEYMLRNFYDLRGAGIEATKIELRIERSNDTGDFSDQMLAESEGGRVDWIRVFGLDRRNQNGALLPDGRPDFTDRLLFLLDLGVVRFPDPTPFSSSPAEVAALSGLQLSQAGVEELQLYAADPDTARFADLYRRDLPQDKIEALRSFQIVGEHTSTSSRLSLNAFNIKEGSEQVTLDGRVLQRDIDYTIDYFSGEITLTQAAAELNAQSNIGVEFEVDPLFGGGRSSLHGVHLGYELGHQKSLSTTWLLQSEPSTARKPRLGEEPNRAYVGNLAAKLRFSPYFLTRMANWLPMVDSKQNSTINFDGEVAVSIPNPNTLRQGYVDDFESADESLVIPMGREGWYWASLPAEPDTLLSGRRFDMDDRAFTRWFRQRPGVLRGELNPELSEQERRDVVQALSMRMISSDPDLSPQTRRWQPGEYGGIMRGFPGQVDLSRAQYLEFWVNDFTGNDPSRREGKLHFDFGEINEDFWWYSRVSQDSLERERKLGLFDTEDVANTGSLTSNPDRGLDGFFDSDELEPAFEFAAAPADDRAGDNYDAVPEPLASGHDALLNARPYLRGEEFLYINGTEANQRLDQEDLDLNRIFDLDDGYFTLELELSNMDDAIVEIYRDYSYDAGFIQDSLNKGNAWRKYRLDLRKLRMVQPDLADGTPYSRTTPDLSRISHFRIWYENPDGTISKANPVVVFADMRFLGNRWLADGLRSGADGRILPPAQRGLNEDFRVGVVNNKENPEYVPPVFPDTRNNVAEKEQSLQFSYTGLREGHELRVRKSTPGAQKLDFLLYGEHSFFWRLPHSNGSRDPSQDLLEAYYWVGTDSTNYYEVATPFTGLSTIAGDWHELRIDLGELSNLRRETAPNDSLYAGTPSAVAVTTGTIHNPVTGEQYRATVRGRPDLRRVSYFYIGLRYRDDGDMIEGPPLDGEVLFNELRLRDVDRDIGFAQRVATNVNIPGFGDMSAEYRQVDDSFRGLDEKVGSNILRRNWSLRGGTALQNLVPTFGLEIPITASIREDSQLPRYQTNSDIELLDDQQRKQEETRNKANQYSVQLRKSKASESRLVQYTLDAFTYSRSESYSEQYSPLVQHSSRRSVDQKFNYDIRLGRGHEVTLPYLDWRFRYLPNQLSLGSDFSFDKSGETRRTRDGVLDRRTPQTNHTMRNTFQLGHNLSENIRASLSMNSNRDLVEREAAGDSLLESTRLFGRSFGRETQFNQNMNVTYNPKLPILRWFSPEVGFNTRYGETRDPGVRQRELASERYVGVGYQVRNVSNGADLSLRGTIDLFGWAKKRWGRPKSPPPTGSPSVIDPLRQGADRPDGAARSLPTPANRPSPATPEDEPQGAGDPGLTPAFGDSTQAPLPEPIDEGEAAEDVDSDPRLQPTEDRPDDDAEEQVEQAPQQEFKPGAAGAALVRPFKNFFLNLKPISTTYNLNRGSSFQHVNSRANLLYRFGLLVGEDNEAAGLTDPVDADIGAGPFSNSGSRRETSVSFSTQSQLYESVRVDLNYRRNESEQGGTIRQSQRSRGNEIGTGFNVSQVQEWRLFRSWFSQAGMQFNYKYTNDVRNAVGEAEFPQIRHTYNPRWNGTFNNGMSAAVNLQYATDDQENNVNVIENRVISANLDLQHRFDAEGRLAFLRFGRKGTGTTIDMTFNLSFRQDSGTTTPKLGSALAQDRGSRTWAVDPRFQYQFSRNVRGGLQLRYSRRTDLGRQLHESTANPVTQSFGIFFDATLSF